MGIEVWAPTLRSSEARTSNTPCWSLLGPSGASNLMLGGEFQTNQKNGVQTKQKEVITLLRSQPFISGIELTINWPGLLTPGIARLGSIEDVAVTILWINVQCEVPEQNKDEMVFIRLHNMRTKNSRRVACILVR